MADLRRLWFDAQAALAYWLAPLLAAWPSPPDPVTGARQDGARQDDTLPADVERDLGRWLRHAAVMQYVAPPPVLGPLSPEVYTRHLEWIRVELGRLGLPRVGAAQALRAYASTDRHVAREMNRILRVDLRARVPGLAGLADSFMAHNVSLIETGIMAPYASPQLRPGLLGDVSHVVEQAFASGQRVEFLAMDLKERFGVSDSRAELIARDQILKLNGQINEARQTAAGVEEYEWSTSQDERVRDDHRDLDTTVHRWDTPPVTDQRTGATNHPGGDYQCRCVAKPRPPVGGAHDYGLAALT